MLVQYLVGLCCVRRNPDAVDVTVGDLVLDVAAQKVRDVDVTVTVREADGSLSAFKAYEVKRESEPLDVAVVEQLCMKLRDMPSVTHRAIVSASSFTSGAIAKAQAHSVDLLVIKPWVGQSANSFGAFEGRERLTPSFSGFDVDLLCWIDHHIFAVVPDDPPPFSFNNSTHVFDANGQLHESTPNMGVYTNALLQRSTQILLPLEPAQTMLRGFSPELAPVEGEFLTSPAVTHTHTLCVNDDNAFLRLNHGLAQIVQVTISGKLQLQRRRRPPDFYILESVPSGEPFTGAAVAEWGTPDGAMLGIIFSPDSPTIGLQTHIRLQDKHKNAIRQLKLDIPRSRS